MQSMTGGLRLSGTVAHVEQSPGTKAALREALLAVYMENQEVLDGLISPTAKLLMVNMQVVFACASKCGKTKVVTSADESGNSSIRKLEVPNETGGT